MPDGGTRVLSGVADVARLLRLTWWPVLAGGAGRVRLYYRTRLPPTGVEPVEDSAGRERHLQGSAAESDALDAKNANSARYRSGAPPANAPNPVLTDPELASLINAWPTLPKAIRRGIL